MQTVEAADAVSDLLTKRSAELRLSAGPFEIQDQLPCDCQGCRVPEIFLNHCQRHVDAGAYPCRCPDGPASYENWIWPDVDRGKSLCKFGATLPMGRGASAIQQAALGQNERSQTNGAKPTHVFCLSDQP